MIIEDKINEFPKNKNIIPFGKKIDLYPISLKLPLIIGDEIPLLYDSLPKLLNDLKSEDENQVCYSIYALKQILKISILINDIQEEFFDYIFNTDTISFFFQKMGEDFVNPFIFKNILKIINIFIIHYPQAIDQFHENGLSDILISSLPNKQSIKCIISLINSDENYRDSLVQSNFYKDILQMIENLSQMHSDIRYLYEKSYIDLLFQLHPFIQFDESDYETFLCFFMRNFHPKNDCQAKSQLSYINFLKNSTDPQLMIKFVSHPSDIICSLLRLFNRPAYSNVRAEVLEYFEQIIRTSEELAANFTKPQIIELIPSMFLPEKYLESTTRFIFSICSSSFTNCQNFINRDIFSDLNFHFSLTNINVQHSIYMTFNQLLRYPTSSNFFPFFSDQQIFDAQSFFEFGDTIVQSEKCDRNEVLNLYSTLLDDFLVNSDDEFLNLFFSHITSEDFNTILLDCISSQDEEFSHLAESLNQKIEETLEKL